MPLVKKPTRYAHPEGHTDVCYFDGEKGGLITCGTDGDVRAWVNLLDDDPSATCISEQATAVISKNEKLYVGNDNNTVQILNHPDLDKVGVVTRFSATVTALATNKKSNLIASGASDMRIHISNIVTMENIELNGHEAPVLGLSLDPKDEFVASSSGDTSIRVWSIKEKKVVQTWNNVVPKCNSFYNAKTYSVPSFCPKSGAYLAYPQGKEVIVTERSSWQEVFRLKSNEIKNDLNICKFSECGKYLAASSVYGELIVWDISNKDAVGFVEYHQNAKITALVWNPSESNEIAFCDSLGQLGCVEVIISNKTNSTNYHSETKQNKITEDDNGDSNDDNLDDIYNNHDKYSDDDDDDMSSINKIKASVLDHDQKSASDVASVKKDDEKAFVPEFNLQEPFQPGSSPSHLLNRYMAYNDVGIVMCFSQENQETSEIQVDFHDVNVHHNMHKMNYFNHTMAALSTAALVLAAPASEIDTQLTPSKVVVVPLQAWGPGNKEWMIDLPEGEDALAVAAGSNFVAVATTSRMLRLFMPCGTQREIIALPGEIVAMNGLGQNLAVVYHSSIGISANDQNMGLLWINVLGPNLKSKTLPIPLSAEATLMWVGFSDLYSPVVMDSKGIINIYDKKAMLWRVACDTSRMNKGKFDHYFIIGINESDRTARCILCKGSHYPPTSPRPIVSEISLTVPLCDPDTERSQKEAKVWQFGSNPMDEEDDLLMLIALAIKYNADFRAVELCQYIASERVLRLAIKFADRSQKLSLANKLKDIADSKEPDEVMKGVDSQEDMFNDEINTVEDQEDLLLTPVVKTPEIQIKPLTPSQPFRRSNPFLSKKCTTPVSKGLSGLDKVEVSTKSNSPVLAVPNNRKVNKSNGKPEAKESFIKWYPKHKDAIETEVKGDSKERIKYAYQKYQTEVNNQIDGNSSMTEEDTSKKRKLDDENSNSDNQPKRTASEKLSMFARNS
ncbi:hypothetical protein TKK_0008609 [Trichogramma kaykai]|uniref:WD repeat-containing protein 55 homolog n=1 Tax=Trichogramma kaykai TaxID=54128 RepID=A0ABD2X5G5_9HYME